MTTAEWICTKCGATNRRLVHKQDTEARDKCLSCHTRHALLKMPRPVRWEATAAK